MCNHRAVAVKKYVWRSRAAGIMNQQGGPRWRAVDQRVKKNSLTDCNHRYDWRRRSDALDRSPVHQWWSNCSITKNKEEIKEAKAATGVGNIWPTMHPELNPQPSRLEPTSPTTTEENCSNWRKPEGGDSNRRQPSGTGDRTADLLCCQARTPHKDEETEDEDGKMKEEERKKTLHWEGKRKKWVIFLSCHVRGSETLALGWRFHYWSFYWAQKIWHVLHHSGSCGKE